MTSGDSSHQFNFTRVVTTRRPLLAFGQNAGLKYWRTGFKFHTGGYIHPFRVVYDTGASKGFRLALARQTVVMTSGVSAPFELLKNALSSNIRIISESGWEAGNAANAVATWDSSL